MLQAGIIGLPNVGKSTLFNGLVRAHLAPAANYPFCTIEPNRGVVAVPDPRLDQLAQVVGVSTRVPAAIEFVDIAGLVRGASKGEGLGNQFLSHIREVDALVHVVRCFEDPDVVHVTGDPDPVRDIEIVLTELVWADLEVVERRRQRLAREVRAGDKHAIAEDHVLQKLLRHLESGRPALTAGLTREEQACLISCPLLSLKPMVLAANVRESQLSQADVDPYVQAVRQYVRAHHGCDTVVVCAQLESDLVDLSPEEASEYLNSLGLQDTGGSALIQAVYRLLNLRTFFTFNENEVRAWTIPAGTSAARAAGRIHTDFEKGFIKAERIFWKDLVEAGSVAHARERGHYAHEGREYVVQDGDVLLFRFHV
ncbi:MAG: redox-regulated ATPase YchF [Verrucomicrobiota bacterium]|nr:redox-regulated ATPase YchF [Limisphaera sp.]MDW8381275.1 redox-regulated ATPase YchF [Verrucomicrobiota bacterium]